MEDKTLRCEECGREFTLTPGEQQLYSERGMDDPNICKECRRAHKDEVSQIIGEGEGGGVGGPFNT